MKILRLIGDVHGYYSQYLKLIQNVDYSIQLGDFGFDYSCLDKVDSTKHKILPGNHDNYEKLPVHAIHPFGVLTIPIIGDIFYIRGANSIDKIYRTPGISWWSQEQLTTKQGEDCIKLFQQIKPNFVISHDCPISIYPLVLKNPWCIKETWTAKVLEECLKYHQPKKWIFAHHHVKWSDKIGKTQFRCLNELEFMDL